MRPLKIDFTGDFLFHMTISNGDHKYYWVNIANHRYYYAYIKQDLLGDWVVQTFWGTKNTNFGGMKTVYCDSEIKAKKYLERINKIRHRRGYIIH